jgi:hypothetical protein
MVSTGTARATFDRRPFNRRRPLYVTIVSMGSDHGLVPVRIGSVQINIPRAVVPDLLRGIAELVEIADPHGMSAGVRAPVREPSLDDWGPQDPWEPYTEDYDELAETVWIFWQGVLPAEREMLKELAMREETPAIEIAEALDIGVSALAGLVGPLNKRCFSMHLPPAVMSRTVMTGSAGARKRSKALSITHGLRRVIERAIAQEDSGKDE